MEPQKTFIISNEQRFPWLTSDQIWRIEQLTKNYSWTQKLKVQQQLYQQAITQLKNQEVTDNRFALKNDIFCKSLDKDSKEKTTDQCNVRLEDLADIVKDKYHLNANTETNVVMNWIISMAKDKNVSTDLLNDYLDEWNKEFLYQMWFEERPIEEEKWTNWLKNIWYYLNPVWQLTSDVTNWAVNHPKESAEVWVWFAQSPWKRWYNIIWQWMDRLGKEVSDELEWSALERYVKNAATKVFWEDAIKEYEQIQQQRVNKWSSILWDSAYYGREQSNIRTPLLWTERAESEYTKWWEMAWDLATAVALSSPMAAATAPYMWTESLWQAWLTALLWWSQWWLDMAAYEYWANQELATPWEIAFWMWAWAATPFIVPLWWKLLKWVNNKYNEINQLLKNSSKEQLWEELKTLFSKWVRPSSLWVKTTKAQEKIYDDALDAVETIINNKNNLKFTNANWEVIEWQLPKNSYEFAQAIDQTKKATFDQYIAMVWDAWKQTRVSVEDLTDELLKLKKDKAALLWNPWLENAIDNWLRWLREIEDLSVEQAQRKVQEINKKLEAFYKNPNPNDVSWNAIDALVKNKLNEWIDNAIDQTLWSSEEFEALKRAYWSLKTIEKDVNHRAIVAWRQSPNSLVDSIADISSVESLLDVLTWSPVWAVKALGKQALKKYVKNANSSDNMIRKLFEKANKWLEKSWTLKTRQQLLKQQQEQYNRWLNKSYNKNYLPYIEWGNDAWKTVIPSWKTIAVTPEWDAVREWFVNDVNKVNKITKASEKASELVPNKENTLDMDLYDEIMEWISNPVSWEATPYTREFDENFVKNRLKQYWISESTWNKIKDAVGTAEDLWEEFVEWIWWWFDFIKRWWKIYDSEWNLVSKASNSVKKTELNLWDKINDTYYKEYEDAVKRIDENPKLDTPEKRLEAKKQQELLAVSKSNKDEIFKQYREEKMKPKKEWITYVNPDDFRPFVNKQVWWDYEANLTHEWASWLADEYFKDLLSKQTKGSKWIVVAGWPWSWKWYSAWKLGIDAHDAWIFVDKTKGNKELEAMLDKWMDVDYYMVIPEAENIIKQITWRAINKWRTLPIKSVWIPTHKKVVEILDKVMDLKKKWGKFNFNFIYNSWEEWATPIKLSFKDWYSLFKKYANDLEWITPEKIEAWVRAVKTEKWKATEKQVKELIASVWWFLAIWSLLWADWWDWIES